MEGGLLGCVRADSSQLLLLLLLLLYLSVAVCVVLPSLGAWYLVGGTAAGWLYERSDSLAAIEGAMLALLHSLRINHFRRSRSPSFTGALIGYTVSLHSY